MKKQVTRNETEFEIVWKRSFFSLVLVYEVNVGPHNAVYWERCLVGPSQDHIIRMNSFWYA